MSNDERFMDFQSFSIGILKRDSIALSLAIRDGESIGYTHSERIYRTTLDTVLLSKGKDRTRIIIFKDVKCLESFINKIK